MMGAAGGRGGGGYPGAAMYGAYGTSNDNRSQSVCLSFRFLLNILSCTRVHVLL